MAAAVVAEVGADDVSIYADCWTGTVVVAVGQQPVVGHTEDHRDPGILEHCSYSSEDMS